MVQAQSRQNAPIDAAGAHFILVEGRYYEDLNDQLLAGAKAVLAAAGARVDVVTVPGALEIAPAMSILLRKAAASGRRIDGFVAIGIVMRGETTHYDIVSNESARALIDLATREGLALGNAILTVETREQAETRADPARGDKGGEAARAALTLHALKRGGGA